MVALKVNMLAEKISSTYLLVSDSHVLQARRIVGHMMECIEDESPAGKATLQGACIEPSIWVFR